MRFHDDFTPSDPLDDDFTPSDPLDDDFQLGDDVADVAATVQCPYCGAAVEIALDPGSGSTQRYVEDCEVCCRPWLVHVAYDGSGAAHVTVEPADDA